MMELPSFFQPDQNTKGPPSNEPKILVRYYEKTILNLAIHSRMLRLHRPWLSRGYEDERFAYSKEQCIRAARASLRMMSDGTASYLEKWWLPLFYVSVSGLVVIIDLLVSRRIVSRFWSQLTVMCRGQVERICSRLRLRRRSMRSRTL